MTVSGKKIIERQRNIGSIKDTNLYKNLTQGTTTSNSSDIEIQNTESLNNTNIQSDTRNVTDILKQQQLDKSGNLPVIQKINAISPQNQPKTTMTAGTAPTPEEQKQKLNELMMDQKIEAAQYEAEKRGTWDNVVHQNIGPNEPGWKNALEAGKGLLDFVGDKVQRVFAYETDQALTFAENELQTQYTNAKALTEQSEVAEQQWNNVFRTQDKQYGPFAQPQISPEVIQNITKHPNKWLNNDGTEMYMSNGKTTISKPIIKVKTYSETLQDLYNDITYEFAQNGNVYSIEQIRDAYPEFYDQSDNIIRNFIEDCLYDVQQGKRRPIESYVEHYAGMSKSDGYLHQQDALMTALTNEDIIATSIGLFANGSLELPGRTPEELTEYIQSVYTIQNIVDQYNKAGYNETNAGTYIMAKTFADKNPLLKKALDTYDKFKLTNQETTIFATQYKKTKDDLQEIASNFEGMTLSEYTREIMDIKTDYINYIKQTVDNEINKNRSESRWLSSDYSPVGVLENILLGEYYEDDGKLYDMDGNEIDINEMKGGAGTKIVNSLISQSQGFQTLSSDVSVLQEEQNAENVFNVGADIVNSAFDIMMNETLGGIGFQAVGTMGAGGHMIESALMAPIEGFGSLVGGLANLIGVTDGWSDKSKEKLKQAAGGLLFMGIMRNKKVQAFKKMADQAFIGGVISGVKGFNESVIKKSVDAYTAELMKGVETVEVMELKDQIKETTTPKLEGEVDVKDTTKMSAEEKEQLETKTTTRRFNINRQTFQNAKNAFRKTFEEEYSKKLQSEGYKPTILDTLYNKVLETRGEIQKENYETTKQEIQKNQRGVEEPTKPTTNVEEPTKVEEPTTTPEVIEAKDIVEEPNEVQQQESTRTASLKATLKGMMQLMKDYVDHRKQVKQDKKAQKELEQFDKSLTEDKFIESERKVIENNPYSDILLDIVNESTTEIRDKKGNLKSVDLEGGDVIEMTYNTEAGDIKEVQVKLNKTNDEIQREVLSQGFMKLQQVIDGIIEEKRKIGALYEKTSRDANIDTRGFKRMPELLELLKKNGLRLIEKYNFDKGENEIKIEEEMGGEMNPKQSQMATYFQKVLDLLGERKITEHDAQALREKFKFEKDPIGDIAKSFYNQMRGLFNKFLDTQASQTKLLRTIDKHYSEQLEKLKIFDELTSKDHNIKKSAKNKILNMSPTELEMLEEFVPGITKLVELAKASPDIVKKMIKAKIKQKDTRRRLGDTVRYFFVSAPSLFPLGGYFAGGIGGSVLGMFVGSAIFKGSNAIGNKLKKKIVGKEPDLELWNQLIDNLEIGENSKTKYKKKLLNDIEELNKVKLSDRKKEFDETMGEISEIIIDRTSKEIQAKRDQERKMEEQRKKQEQRKQEQKEQKEEVKEQTNQEIKEEPKEITPKEPEQTAEDFVNEMFDTAPKEQEGLRLDKMSDEALYKLREDPNIPEETKAQIEDIVNNRYMNEIKRETQKGVSEQITARDEVEFIRRAHQLQDMEKNLGKVGKNKIQDPDKKKNQEMEFLKKKESFIEEIMQAYGLDQFQAYDKFQEFENRGVDEEKYSKREGSKNKNDYDREHKEEITALREQRKKDAEEKIIEASEGKEEGKEYSPEAIDFVEKVENLANTLKEIEEEIVLEQLEQEGKEITQTSLEQKKQEIVESDTTGNEILDQIMGKTEEAIQEKQEVIKKEIKKKTKKKTKAEEVSTQQNEQLLEITEPETKAEERVIKVDDLFSGEEYYDRDSKDHKEIDRLKNMGIEELLDQPDSVNKFFALQYKTFSNSRIPEQEYREIAKQKTEELRKKYAPEEGLKSVYLQQESKEIKPTKKEKTKKATTPEYVSEKTSTYEWKGKENIEKFNEEFKDDENLYEEDAYGENVGISKEAKLHNYVFQKFNKVETSDSPMTNDRYNEQVAKTTSIYNTNISYKDINLKYFTTELNYQKGTGAPKDAKAQFDRDNVEISIGDKKNRYTVMHEVTHSLDYKFAKELGYDGTMPLSEIVMGEGFKSDNALVNRFKNFIEEINTGDPAESFAKFGEQFGEWTEGRKSKSNTSIKRFIDWLSDMADAREKGELEDGTLENTEGGDIKYFRPKQVTDPQLKADIEWIRQEFGYSEDLSEQTVLRKANATLPKGANAYKLTPKQQRIYDIKNRYVERQIKELGEKIMDFGDTTITDKNNPETGQKHMFNGQTVNGTTVHMGGFAPHIVGQLYQNLKQAGYIVSPGEFNKRRKQKKQNQVPPYDRTNIIQRYTSADKYMDDTEKDQLSDLIQKEGTSDFKNPLYRSVRPEQLGYKNIKDIEDHREELKGKKITSDNFLSTSKTVQGTFGFVGQLIEFVEVEEGAKGLDISKESTKKREQEVLFDRGTSYEITEVNPVYIDGKLNNLEIKAKILK